jgi:t-SNARE complex subunit (syntaxin)
MIENEGDQDKLRRFNEKMAGRTKRISNITDTIARVHDLFKDLNEIVVEQG